MPSPIELLRNWRYDLERHEFDSWVHYAPASIFKPEDPAKRPRIFSNGPIIEKQPSQSHLADTTSTLVDPADVDEVVSIVVDDNQDIVDFASASTATLVESTKDDESDSSSLAEFKAWMSTVEQTPEGLAPSALFVELKVDLPQPVRDTLASPKHGSDSSDTACASDASARLSSYSHKRSHSHDRPAGSGPCDLAANVLHSTWQDWVHKVDVLAAARSRAIIPVAESVTDEHWPEFYIWRPKSRVVLQAWTTKACPTTTSPAPYIHDQLVATPHLRGGACLVNTRPSSLHGCDGGPEPTPAQIWMSLPLQLPARYIMKPPTTPPQPLIAPPLPATKVEVTHHGPTTVTKGFQALILHWTCEMPPPPIRYKYIEPLSPTYARMSRQMATIHEMGRSFPERDLELSYAWTKEEQDTRATFGLGACPKKRGWSM